jgi:hypothetical protein
MLIKSFSVPSDYSLGFNNYQTFLPIHKEGDDGGKEEFIPSGNLNLF